MMSRTSFLQVRIRKCCPANSSSGRSNIVETWRGKYHQHGHCEKQNSLLQNFIVRNKSKAKVKPFSIIGLQQIAVGDTDSKAMTNLWVDIFGLAKVGDFTSDKENVSEDILKLGSDNGNSVSVEVDLMCPLKEDKSPKVHKPPLNHIGLWVDDLESAVEWMTLNGVRFTPGGIRKGAAGHNVTFIHPKGNDDFPVGGCGVLIELVQAPDDVVAKLK